MSDSTYLIGKFTQFLGDAISYRGSDPKNRTEDDFEILAISLDENTEFGIQGYLALWHGDGEDFDWENYDHDDWGASTSFFEFQSFLEFYTAPTTSEDKSKLVLYTPKHDWTSNQSVVIEEFTFENDSFGDLNDLNTVAELLCLMLNEKYRLIRVSEQYLQKYIDKKKS